MGKEKQVGFKVSKWKKAVLIILCAAIVITVSATVPKAIIFEKKVKSYRGTVHAPSIDFVQPWMLEAYTDSDYDTYFSLLAQAGYSKIILQWTASMSGDTAVAYFPSETLQKSYGENLASENSGLLSALLTAARRNSFKVFVGLSLDYDWWAISNFTSSDYMQARALVDNLLVSEIMSLYGQEFSDVICGIYWAFEIFTNPVGLGSKWADMLNTTIDALNEYAEGLPLMFSPFHHKFLRGGSVLTYNMWKSFLTAVNFRQGDIFAPQDSVGKISSERAEKLPLASTYNYLKAASSAAAQIEGLEFYVNAELFGTKSLFAAEGDFTTADIERIDYQLKIASQFTQNIVTFSYSHYVLPSSSYAPEGLHARYIEYLKTL